MSALAQEAVLNTPMWVNKGLFNPSYVGGEQDQRFGVMLTSKAIAIALEEGTDLVEVAPGADPPVCRLMDYGKFLYEAQKREKDARKTQTKVEIKEIRLRPKTGDHDISYKLKRARTFLERGISHA